MKSDSDVFSLMMLGLWGIVVEEAERICKQNHDIIGVKHVDM